METKPGSRLAFLWPNDVRVQLPLAAADVLAPQHSSKNTGSHSRAKAPLVPPAARKALSALSLIAFALACRYFFLALSIRSTFPACRMAISSRMAALSARRDSSDLSRVVGITTDHTVL